MVTLPLVRGLDKATPAFLQKVVAVAGRLAMNPDHLVAVMGFESAGSFSAARRNPLSGAVGLIQFTDSPIGKGVASNLGTSLSALAAMTPEAQLDYVEKYLRRYAGRMTTMQDAYLAVFAPAFIGRSSDTVLYASPSLAYTQNRPLDRAGKGAITVADAVAGPAAVLASAKGQRLPVPDDDALFFSSSSPPPLPSSSPEVPSEPPMVEAAPPTVPDALAAPVVPATPPRFTPWAIVVDVAAVAVFGGLVFAGKLDSSTAGALILAVCAGRLDPKALGTLPSGVAAIFSFLTGNRKS